MLSCTAETYVHSQPDRVFGVFTDLKAVGERLSAIEEIDMLTDGPMGEGTRWRETRELMGRRVTEELEIVAFDPPGRYGMETDSRGTHCRTVFRFEPKGGEPGCG